MSALFACSKCFSRHPFEELSAGQQLCKECRGSFPVVKCTYCRSEFQQTNKSSPSAICKKCEASVKSYGKPSACGYCNIIAAFIGNKCQRCNNAEKKYGPPVTCEQCKQKCAFDRKDEDKKVDGKLLCWLCTLSYKRALAKTKQTDSERRAHLKLASSSHKKEPSKHKRHQRPDVTKMILPTPPGQDGNEGGGPPAKISRASVAGNNRLVDIHDPNSSDHVVAMTQLRDRIASLQRAISLKDNMLLTKDKLITELKAKHFTSENELRSKMKSNMNDHEKKHEILSQRIKTLQKQVASLSKLTTNSNATNKKKTVASNIDVAGTASDSDDNDSPSLA
uniref:Protein FAM76A n=2 Tax=Timema TaxID=61471 RepID=A0A7R9IIW7_9NEOP|nr:unnamed protein product [Timema bartmani]CAD7458953.1 unnamed protein product [Timema tahoe]